MILYDHYGLSPYNMFFMLVTIVVPLTVLAFNNYYFIYLSCFFVSYFSIVVNLFFKPCISDYDSFSFYFNSSPICIDVFIYEDIVSFSGLFDFLSSSSYFYAISLSLSFYFSIFYFFFYYILSVSESSSG